MCKFKAAWPFSFLYSTLSIVKKCRKTLASFSFFSHLVVCVVMRNTVWYVPMADSNEPWTARVLLRCFPFFRFSNFPLVYLFLEEFISFWRTSFFYNFLSFEKEKIATCWDWWMFWLYAHGVHNCRVIKGLLESYLLLWRMHLASSKR